ncbi:helix-turn-helix protein [Herbihabitans rhizosphaerae]|uniref:Helix-turn-helix protein n=2 Tax=Herbihabitans rhizosphaerae TaxID=1872711 RepID=A0A4Q7KHE2_9PSEU|nr:helix-turn-helix protein [Herbihabitans rhizosphaerae]
MRKANMTAKQTANVLGWSDSKLSRMINGSRGASGEDVSALLAILLVTGKERRRLMSLCKEQDKPGLLQQFGNRLPRQLRTLIDHEDKAVKVGDFQGLVIPGLLQTQEYARALLEEAGRVPEEEIGDRVAARLARQSRLGGRDAPEFQFFVHEFVLRLPVGGQVIMSDQLHHLLRASVRRNVSLRVVPAAVGAHAGTGGSFKLMEFADFRPVVYLESETSCLFLEEPQEAAAYQEILAALDETALSERESREVIATLATELYADREDHDDSA